MRQEQESPPLSTPLSHVLLAFTIEFDNEFERRFAETGIGRRFGVSMVMWSNFLRFVEDGTAVEALPSAAGLPKARLLSTLGGMERWGYVCVDPDGSGRRPESKRDGFGSARGLRGDWVIRPTLAGEKAREIWRPLFDVIERRWEERFGVDEISELRQSLEAVLERVDGELPEYLPIVVGATGMAAEIVPRETANAEPGLPFHLPTLLAQVLLAYTLEYEREADVPLPLSANFLRVLDEAGRDVRVLPALAGVSKEATSMALTFLTKNAYAVVQPDPSDTRTKVVRLTQKGCGARDAAPPLHGALESHWETRFGAARLRRLRLALQRVLDQRDGERPRLSLGLLPHPDGWRATKAYAEQTAAVIADPIGRLPHYPLVLHRGGWPDGS